jgi:acid stress-induced BolA-like protein IbaG/YrbA
VDADKVTALVSAVFDGDEIFVDGEGAKYNITVVSNQFAGQRPVVRQQAVYGALNTSIASGSIHAVNLRTYTPEEWAAAQD